MGTGSGILAMAAARLLNRPVLATDIEPWAVRVAAENAALNGVAGLVRCGWRMAGAIRSCARGGPYDLVFANILARPLCLMARDLALNLAPGGTAILAGLLAEPGALGAGGASRPGAAAGTDAAAGSLDNGGRAEGLITAGCA